MSVSKAMNELYYSKINGDMTELIDLKEVMAHTLLENKDMCDRVVKDGDVAFLQKKVTKGLLAGREKKDFTRMEEQGISQKDLNPFLSASVVKKIIATELTLPVDLEGNYYFKGYRTTKVSIPNMCITPKTVLEVKKTTNVYATEKFSLAFTKEEEGQLLGFSLAVVPATTGVKGKAQCIVTCLTPEAYIIDDASKYMDVEELIKGMSV